MKSAQPDNLPDMGNNLGPVVSEPPTQGAPANVEAHIAALAQQISALTALVATTVQQQAAGMKFVGVNEQQPLPELPLTPMNEKRIRIVLEDNDEIPPGGQFMQLDGRPFLLRSGEPVDVPVGLVDILDHALRSVPVCDENRNIIGYRDRLRFPYRVVRDRDDRDRDDRGVHAEEAEGPAAHVSME